jgi:hypothetical protein
MGLVEEHTDMYEDYYLYEIRFNVKVSSRLVLSDGRALLEITQKKAKL